MAYSSSNPPIKDISILSVQGCVHRLWHNACFLMMLSGEVQVRVDNHATYLNDNGIMLVEPDKPFDITGHGSNLLMIICMDYNNIRNIKRITGGDPDSKISMLLDYTDRAGDEVADPWYTGNFDATWRDVVDGCEGLLETLLRTDKNR